MYKKFFLWLQILALKRKDINLSLISKLKVVAKESIYYLYNDNNLLLKLLNDIKASKELIKCFTDEKIKIKVEKIYNKVILNKLYIITIDDIEYPRKVLDENINIFCYISNKRVNMNNKNTYIYYNKYYTKFARNLLKYFAKIVIEEKNNLITEFDCLNKTEVITLNNFKFNIENNSNNYIVLLDNKYIDIFKINIIDIAIIIEARYEEKIVNFVNNLLDSNRDIFVVPSNIYRKNSYFSNYLIKQGADIILNKNDLKFILSRIIC